MANDNRTWYENIIRKGTLRASGMNEITETNALDWTRLRILEGGKLIPAMAKGHSGAPGAYDLDLLREAAEKGNLFLYRMGEEYPHQLVDGVWYSTDPAIAEQKKPELNLPKAPEGPPPFTDTLEDELRARNFEPGTKREDLQDDGTRQRYDQAVAALSSKKAAHEAAQKRFDIERDRYSKKTVQLRTDHRNELEAWEKRAKFFSNLSTDVKRAVRDEVLPRREEIRRNQEHRRAAVIDSRPLVNWYNNEFSKSVLQSADGPKPQGGAMDWSQVRIWDGEKFAQVMPRGHRGAPDLQGIKRLRDAVEQNNLFAYWAGEEYPRRLENGVWYATDPAVTQEKKPELKLPEAPKEPSPFTATLESELRERGFDREVRRDDLQNDDARRRYDEAVAALSSKQTAHRTAQEQYQEAQKQYQEECTRLEQAHQTAVQDWEKRVGFYDGLDPEVKQAIQEGVSRRQGEIQAEQENQRAAMDKEPLGNWYNNEFRRNMVQPSKDPELLSSDGIDWSRVRIWDGQKFARAMPEGHKGVPDTQTIRTLRDAAEQGNLFMYQRGDKYPSKWMGDYWSSMDKSWIESCKPQRLEEQTNLPERPKMVEPLLVTATKGLSNRKLATNRFFARLRINVYKEEAEKYDRAIAKYEREKAEYDAAMAKYNNEMETRRGAYKERRDVYREMLAAYEGLSPEQRAAMEKDVQQRTEEIERNKEVEKKIAEIKLARELDFKEKIANAGARIDAMDNQPDQEKFLNQGSEPLGQQAYDIVAPHGYELPFGTGFAPAEVAAIHLALAGSNQVAKDRGLSPANAQQYGQMLGGVLHGSPADMDWKYITASYDAANEYIGAYENGDPKQLAEAMSDGVRNLMNASQGFLNMSPEMASLAKLTGRIMNVMDSRQDLMEHCTLNPAEMAFARGLVNLGRIYDQYLDARMALTLMSAGAQKLSQQDLNKHTANLLIGKMVDSRLNREQQGLEQPQLMGSLGKNGGKALDVVQSVYQNDRTIQTFANDPQTGATEDLDKRAKQLAHLFGTSALGRPKESAQLRTQILNQVKEQAKMNEREALEAAKRVEQLENMERQQVRSLLAQQDSRYSTMALQNPAITEKLEELRSAREALEAREARDLKAGQEPKRYELTDDLVQKEAMDRASVWELMQRQNPGRWANQKRGTEISEFAINRRLAELRAAQKQLNAADGIDYELTGEEVVVKAAENQSLRTGQYKESIAELVQAQQVYTKETGIQPKPTDNPPLYRSPKVYDRLKQLKKTKDEMGEAGKDLALNDMSVIQADYKRRGKDPLKEGIVDENTLNDEQRKEYIAGLEAADFLKNVRGVKGLHANVARYDPRVDTAVGNLRTARSEYEQMLTRTGQNLPEAEKNLPLNDPRVVAMHLYNLAKPNRSALEKVNAEDIDRLSREIQGKPYTEAYDIAGQHMKEIQARQPELNQQQIQQQQVQQQQQVPQMPPIN